MTITHKVNRNSGHGISCRQLQFEVEILASSNPPRSPRRFVAPYSQCILAPNQQRTAIPNRSYIKVACKGISVEHGPPATSKHPVIGVYISREGVDRSGIFDLTQRCHLTFKLCRVPEVIGVEKRDKFACRLANTDV